MVSYPSKVNFIKKLKKEIDPNFLFFLIEEEIKNLKEMKQVNKVKGRGVFFV